LRLRVKSWIEGIPYKELALREAFGLTVHDLLLIERRTGECLDRWHASPDRPMGAENDRLFTSMLSAIAEFSREALKDDKGELREMDFGGSRVFLRGETGPRAAVISGNACRDATRPARYSGSPTTAFAPGPRRNAEKGVAAQTRRIWIP